MGDLIHIQIQEHENGTKTVEVVVDNEDSFRFDLSVFPQVQGVIADNLCLRHLERFFHTDPSSSGIIYPPPDIADMR